MYADDAIILDELEILIVMLVVSSALLLILANFRKTVSYWIIPILLALCELIHAFYSPQAPLADTKDYSVRLGTNLILLGITMFLIFMFALTTYIWVKLLVDMDRVSNEFQRLVSIITWFHKPLVFALSTSTILLIGRITILGVLFRIKIFNVE